MAKAKPIRLAIAGLGRAGRFMQCEELKGREKFFEIVAMCDVLKARRDWAAETYKCNTYRRVEDLVADSNVEMVSIATRSVDHFAHAALALKAGKHVLVEKPMTVTHDEARKLRSLAARGRGKLYVRQNRRYEGAFCHIREIMASGILGDIFQISLRRNGYSRRDDWQTLKRFGGGQLLNWGPHIIDHALQMLDSPVKDIWSDLKQIAAAGDAEDHLKIILTGRNGCVVDLEISGGAAVGGPTYLVLGSRGALTCNGSITLRYLDPRRKLAPRKADPASPPAMTFGSKDNLKWIEKTIPVDPKKKTSMTMIWDDLYQAVRNRKRFPIALDEAVEVMKVVSAAKKGTRFEVKGRRK